MGIAVSYSTHRVNVRIKGINARESTLKTLKCYETWYDVMFKSKNCNDF